MRSLLLEISAWAKSEGGPDAVMRRNPWLLKRVRAALEIVRTGSESDIAAYGESLTRRTLRAARNTAYGRKRGLSLEAWPVLTKTLLRDHPEQFVNRFALPRIPAGTSGTTGMPLALWRSLECISAEQAFIDNLLAPHGFSMHQAKIAVLRADSIKAPEDNAPPYGRISHGEKRLTLSTLHLNAATLSWYHDALTRFAPSVLWVYPGAACNLLALLARAKLSLGIPVILASSEELSAAMHEALGDYFGAQVINYYGQAERVALAVSTRPGEFRFHPAYGRVELGAPEALAGGECRARILATGYWNQAMPLVRYDTGDAIYLAGEYGERDVSDIACGIRPFKGLAGRDSEYLITREGLHIIGLNQIPRGVETIYQMQLVQTGLETVQVNVLAKPGFDRKDAVRIREQARARLPASLEITVTKVERLEATKSGKTPFVIRRI